MDTHHRRGYCCPKTASERVIHTRVSSVHYYQGTNDSHTTDFHNKYKRVEQRVQREQAPNE